MRINLKKITANDLNGTSYKGHAIFTTALQLLHAIGEPNVCENGVCEWYLQHSEIKFSLYNHNVTNENETVWFRIGASSNINSIEVLDMITNVLKTS